MCSVSETAQVEVEKWTSASPWFEGWYNVRLLICEVTSGAGPGRFWHIACHVIQPMLYPRSLHAVLGMVPELRS